MKTGNTWVDGMHEHAQSLRSIARQLDNLGRAFTRTGNEVVGAELWEVVRLVDAQAEAAGKLMSDKIASDYAEAVQGSSNVLRAALAAAEIAAVKPA